jgi:hypothetical protein
MWEVGGGGEKSDTHADVDEGSERHDVAHSTGQYGARGEIAQLRHACAQQRRWNVGARVAAGRRDGMQQVREGGLPDPHRPCHLHIRSHAAHVVPQSAALRCSRLTAVKVCGAGSRVTCSFA